VLDGILYTKIWYQHNGMDSENSNTVYYKLACVTFQLQTTYIGLY
jgi:hypothetical protein